MEGKAITAERNQAAALFLGLCRNTVQTPSVEVALSDMIAC